MSKLLGRPQSSLEISPQNRKAETSTLLGCVKSSLGIQLLSWKDCGDDLYADFPESDVDSLQQLRGMLHCQDNQREHTTEKPPPRGPPTVQGGATSATRPAPSSLSRQLPSFDQDLESGGHPQGQQPAAMAAQPPHVTGKGATQKRFIELCINTGEF
ncbi:hypothetical protein B0T26DRAFT_751495 [Lasiosphaeria miniovina]|uniref:Uncharacterized protein n=1 Tax=Lasiosphaeria miniovina TaxID=1954250 RepID=A0AA40AKA6_9PEZI|nr:uncharacterized protein B0T26DRAFT_751495 [Lasiosphaeria miniovina]KAK0717436.1 hypothetical protein B0T26DRAFT_751495 [Lasiosphaeria miniovina]